MASVTTKSARVAARAALAAAQEEQARQRR
jgi:hypothetical protein